VTAVHKINYNDDDDDDDSGGGDSGEHKMETHLQDRSPSKISFNV